MIIKSRIALYDKYVDGKLEREFFLNEKKQYDADMEKMEEELAALRQAQQEEENEQEDSGRKADQAMAFPRRTGSQYQSWKQESFLPP